jgi:hypothetical protein
MNIRFDIPKQIEALLDRDTDPNLDAREAFLVDLYRRGVLTHDQLGHALGLAWYETEGVLKRHDVPSDTTWEQVEVDAEALRKLIKR